MPALGESVTEGTVTRWLKKEGDQIAVDEPLLEVSTDKVDTEIPSPVAGVLQKIIVQVDSTVAVGAELAVIAESSSPAKAAAPAPVVAAAPVVEQKPVAVAPVVAAPVVEPKPVVAAPVVAPAPVISAQVNTTRSDDTYVTPIVRKLAAEAGVNLSTITGTGVGGRIRKEDILAAAPRAAATHTATAKNGKKVNLTPSLASKDALAAMRRRSIFVTSTSTTVVN